MKILIEWLLCRLFGQEGHVCQATELWRIRNDYENFPEVAE